MSENPRIRYHFNLPVPPYLIFTGTIFYSPVPFYFIFTGTTIYSPVSFYFIFTGTTIYSPVQFYFIFTGTIYLFTGTVLFYLHRYHFLYSPVLFFIHRYLNFHSSGPGRILFTGPELIIGSILITGPAFPGSGLTDFTGLIVFYTRVPTQSEITGPTY